MEVSFLLLLLIVPAVAAMAKGRESQQWSRKGRRLED